MELEPEGGSWFIEMKREASEETVIQCVIEWSVADRGGEVQAVPEGLRQALR
jgi:hypothetical protein